MRACSKTLESELAPEELDYLLETIDHSGYLGRHLEIGTAAGGTLWQMIGKIRPDNPHRFTVIDPMTYFPNQYSLVRQNLIKHGISLDKVDFRIETSHEAFERAERRHEYYDFILIDGNHKLRYIVSDLRWTRLLNVGGKVAIHDYNFHFPSVRMAVDKFLKKYPSYRFFGHVRDLVILEKCEKSKKAEVTDLDLLFAEIFTPVMQWKRSFAKRIANLKDT